MNKLTHVNFIDDAPTEISNENKAIDNFADLSGHVMSRDNNTNFYFWGKDPIGGGKLIFGSYENIELQGLKQRALRMISSSKASLVLSMEVNCTAKTTQTLCAGIIDIKSKEYNHIDEVKVSNLTTAKYSKRFDFERNQDFVLVLWQKDIGDAIEIFHQSSQNWKSIVNFHF